MILLDTRLSESEKRIIENYISEYDTEIKLFCAVDEKRLFHTGAQQRLTAINNANRMIDVGGLVLLEEKLRYWKLEHGQF